MEKIRVNLGIGYPGIFLIWMIAVAVIQLSKLVFLTPYQMPKDKRRRFLVPTGFLYTFFRPHIYPVERPTQFRNPNLHIYN